MKTLLFATLIMIASAASADEHQPLPLNFNQEIEQNNADAQDLSKDVSAMVTDQAEPKAQASAAKDDGDQVTNFVDFEIESVNGQQVSQSQ